MQSKCSIFLLSLILLLGTAAYLPAQGEAEAPNLEAFKESVVSFFIEGDDKIEIARGSGFIIGKDLMVTNYHLVSQGKEAEGKDSRGKKVKIEGIISFDKHYNLAVLKVKSKAPALKVGSFADIKFGSMLYAMGGNEVGEIEVYDGKVINVAEFEPGISAADTGITAPDTLSGGPVFDDQGQLVGIILYPDGTSKVIIPAELVNKLSTTGNRTKFKDRDPEDYFATYEGAYLAGRLFTAIDSTNKAAKFLNEVLKSKPDELPALEMLAGVYTKQRNYSSAVQTYQQILQLKPESESAHMGIGQVYIRMMKWKEAIPPLEKALQLNPGNTQAFQMIGKAYQEQRIFDKAAEYYEKHLAANPQSPGEVPYQLGLCYFEQEMFPEAIKALETALQAEPQNEALIEKLALAYQKTGQYDKAEASFTQLAQLSPQNAKFYFNSMIRMYDEAGMPEKAVTVAQLMIEQDPSNAEAVYNLGAMYVKMKEWDEAAAAFEKAIKLQPDFEYAYANLGNCYYQAKNYSKAAEVFQKLTEIAPDSSDGWLNLGIAYMQMKQFGKSVEPLRKVIELRPEYGTAYFNLGIAYLNLKDNASAREIYLKLRNVDMGLAQKLLKYIR